MSHSATLPAPPYDRDLRSAQAAAQGACHAVPHAPESTARGQTGVGEAEPATTASGLYEATEAGQQRLIAGVAPISLADRLRWRAAAPLVPAKPQRACDLGLFDLNARNQLDLFTKLPPGRPDG